MKFTRCFIAIDLPEDVKEYLASVQLKFSGVPGASLVPKENLHVTILFLGEVDEDSLHGIIGKVEGIAANFHAFKCALGRFELVPLRLPHIAWVSLDCGMLLNELHDSMDEALLAGGGKFSSHITLARIKTSLAAAEISRRAKGIKISRAIFDVGHISIMKSAPAPCGPAYSVIRAIELRA